MTRTARLLLLTIVFRLSAQSEKTFIEGKIINSESGTKVTFVHIWNESKKLMSISDSSGWFRINASVNDTIAIMGLGYLSKKIIVDNNFIYNNMEIKLQPRYYEIEEVEVVALGSYSQFKQKFIDLKIPETELDILRNNLSIESKRVANEAEYNRAMNQAASSGVVASAPILTPEEKQYIKLKEIKKKEEIQKVVDRKFNRQYVADITGLKDKELDEFILFCHFGNDYLFKAKQDEIFLRIIQKFEDFKRVNKREMIEMPYNVLG